MTQRSNYPAQTPQILNDWAPRAKNSCESTTSPLISQLSGSQILKEINLCLAVFIRRSTA